MQAPQALRTPYPDPFKRRNLVGAAEAAMALAVMEAIRDEQHRRELAAYRRYLQRLVAAAEAEAAAAPPGRRVHRRVGVAELTPSEQAWLEHHHGPR